MLVEIDVLDIHIAEFGNTDTGCVDRSYDELITGIIDRINQAQDLVVLEIFYLLLFDPRAVNSRQGVGGYNALGVQVR